MVKITLKWGKEVFNDVEFDPADGVETFQFQIYSLTRVPPERQTIMGLPGGKLKPEDDLTKRAIKEGCKITLMGTAEGGELKEPVEKTKFAEDMTEAEIAAALNEVAKGPLPVGLANLGNTCYMNSCIQMLRQVPELNEALSKEFAGGLGAGGMNVDTVLAKEFYNLLGTMKSSLESVQPMRFLMALRAKVPSFGEMRNGHPQQQDAEECIRNILAAFANALPTKAESGEATNAIDQLFGFQTRSVYKCLECDDEPEQVELTADRFLLCHFGTTTEPISHLREGIKLSLQEHVEKSSPVLGRNAQYQKTAALSTMPTYLVVQFARFGWKAANSAARTDAARVKIGRKVAFPKKLDLFEYAAEDLGQKLQLARQKVAEQRDKDWDAAQAALKAGVNLEKQQQEPGENELENFVDTGSYELVAVVSHQGRTADGGHYVGWAISERGDGKKVKEDTWLLFDDDKVSERPDKAVDLQGGRLDTHIAYFCLYRKLLNRVVEPKIAGAGQVLGGAPASAGSGGEGGAASGRASGAGSSAAPMDVDAGGSA